MEQWLTIFPEHLPFSIHTHIITSELKNNFLSADICRMYWQQFSSSANKIINYQFPSLTGIWNKMVILKKFKVMTNKNKYGILMFAVFTILTCKMMFW